MNSGPLDQSPAANYVYSPSINITPVTPSAQYAPMSTSLDFDSISTNHWQVEGLFVRIKTPIEDESIHRISYTKQNDKASSRASFDFFKLTFDSQKTYVIGGDNKGASGDLLSVDNQDDVVQLHGNISDVDISLIVLKYLCKCT